MKPVCSHIVVFALAAAVPAWASEGQQGSEADLDAKAYKALANQNAELLKALRKRGA